MERRSFLATIASLIPIPFLGRLEKAKPTEEWHVGFTPDTEGFVVKVWPDDSITVHRGSTKLRPKETEDGFLEFFGRTEEWRASLGLRHARRNQLEIDHFAISESVAGNREPIRFGNSPVEFVHTWDVWTSSQPRMFEVTS